MGIDANTVLEDIISFLHSRLSAAELPSTLSKSTHIINDLALDSALSFELLGELEDKYEVSLSLNFLSEVKTLGELADKLCELINTK